MTLTYREQAEMFWRRFNQLDDAFPITLLCETREVDRIERLLAAALQAQGERYDKLRKEYIAYGHKIEQIAGQALGYPWFKDDQKNFPGATEIDGVCVGEHVAETIVAELANKFKAQGERVEALEKERDYWSSQAQVDRGKYFTLQQLATVEQVNQRVMQLEVVIRKSCGPELNCLSNMGIGFIEKAVYWYQQQLATCEARVWEEAAKLIECRAGDLTLEQCEGCGNYDDVATGAGNDQIRNDAALCRAQVTKGG